MLEALKAIKETNIEAKRIIELAAAQVKKIKNDAEQKASNEYEEAYKKTVKPAEQTAIDFNKKAAKDVEQELKNIRSEAEEQAKEFEVMAKRNFDRAVNAVLNELFQEA